MNTVVNSPTPGATPIESNSGIAVSLPKPNETVSSPLKITGLVNGNGWTGFEGQVGMVKLFDSAGKQLALGILTTTTEWTSLPTSFQTTLNFSTNATAGKLVFHNENASGDPSRDKTFMVLVKFK